MLDILRYMKLTGIISATLQRFPLALVSSVLLSVLWVAGTHKATGFIDAQTYGRLVILLVQSVLWFTASKLWAESRGLSFSKSFLKALAGFAVIACTSLIPAEVTVSQGFFSLALLLSLLFAPYFGRESSDDSLWYFNYLAGISVFFATVTVAVFGLGISAVLASVAYLFEIKVAGTVYADVWAVGWGFFWPLYILYSLPRCFDFKKEDCVFPRSVAFIENYVLVPLVMVYMGVLYAYFGKIAVQLALPRGNLSYMICGFGLVGVCVWLVIYPVRDGGTRLLGWFWRNFFRMLLVPVALLFLAVGVRIRDYGVTEERYAIFLCALWFLALIVVFALFRRREIKYVPMTLALLCLLASSGPWGADRLSTSSQVRRLGHLFEQSGLLRDGQLTKTSKKPSFETQKDISSIMDYLIGRNKFKPIEAWFSPMSAELEKAGVAVNKCFYWGDVPCSETNAQKFVEVLGLDYIAPWQEQGHLGFNFAAESDNLRDGMVNIEGYDFATELYAHFSETDWFVTRAAGGRNFTFLLDHTTGVFSVGDDKGRKVSFNLTDKVNELRARGSGLAPVEAQDGGLDVRLVIQKLRGDIRYDQPWIASAQMLVMIRDQ